MSKALRLGYQLKDAGWALATLSIGQWVRHAFPLAIYRRLAGKPAARPKRVPRRRRS